MVFGFFTNCIHIRSAFIWMKIHVIPIFVQIQEQDFLSLNGFISATQLVVATDWLTVITASRLFGLEDFKSNIQMICVFNDTI